MSLLGYQSHSSPCSCLAKGEASCSWNQAVLFPSVTSFAFRPLDDGVPKLAHRQHDWSHQSTSYDLNFSLITIGTVSPMVDASANEQLPILFHRKVSISVYAGNNIAYHFGQVMVSVD